MTYVLPTSTALSRAQRIDQNDLLPLRPALFGPVAALHRYSVAGEKAGILVGSYLPGTNETYAWPNREESASLIDLDYAKVWFENARLLYFSKVIGINGTAYTAGGYRNRVRLSSYVFKTANGTDRSAAFLDRDVAVGDVVWVRGTASAVTYEKTTTVTGFVAEVVAATIDDTTEDAGNEDTQVQSETIEQVVGTPINDVVATADGSAYDSLADGYITRTYTITCIQSSTGGDATTAVLQVESADGLDDVDELVPSAFGAPTNVGTKGLAVTWDIDTGHSSASTLGIDEDDFVAGQQWTCVVNQAYTAPAATGAGTYTGPSDTTYIVTISRGGNVADDEPPQMVVSTTTGIDSSGPTDITAASTPFPIGNYGLTISLNQANLCKGDIFYVEVSAASEGAIRTLVLADDLDAAIATGAVNLDVKLYIPQALIEVEATRVLPDPGTNWTADQDGLTLNEDYQTYDSSWTDDGDPQPLPVMIATVYIEYREWLQEQVTDVTDLNELADVAGTLGTVHPDNPLAWAARCALLNTASEVLPSASTTAPTTTDLVRCVPVLGDPADVDNWDTALELVAGADDVYGLVPLTHDATILSHFVTHVTAQSEETEQKYRVCWLSRSQPSTEALVDASTSSDEEVVLATISQLPGSSPAEYTLLEVTSGNATFSTSGVVAGDTVRFQFTIGDDGEETYSEYVIAEVLSEASLRLEEGPVSAVAVAQRVEVWRTYTSSQMAQKIIDLAESYDSGRVRMVWPDQITTSEGVVEGYHLAAALAGLSGSVCSHQGLKGVEVQGFTATPRSRPLLTQAQLKNMTEGGVFVVQTDRHGTPYVLHPSTTDANGALETSEEMAVRNLDMIRYALLTAWGPYIGSGNNTMGNQNKLRLQAAVIRDHLRAQFIQEIGSPLFELTINSLDTSDANPDVVVASITVEAPVPLNRVELSVALTPSTGE